MLQSAVFGTLTEAGSWGVGLDLGRIDLPGNEIGFAVKSRNPERVDDVPRPQRDVDGLSRRNPNLVCRVENFVRLVAQIAHLPPPLLPRDFNVEGRPLRGLSIRRA
jgi:hypothetical protein